MWRGRRGRRRVGRILKRTWLEGLLLASSSYLANHMTRLVVTAGRGGVVSGEVHHVIVQDRPFDEVTGQTLGTAVHPATKTHAEVVGAVRSTQAKCSPALLVSL